MGGRPRPGRSRRPTRDRPPRRRRRWPGRVGRRARLRRCRRRGRRWRPSGGLGRYGRRRPARTLPAAGALPAALTAPAAARAAPPVRTACGPDAADSSDDPGGNPGGNPGGCASQGGERPAPPAARAIPPARPACAVRPAGAAGPPAVAERLEPMCRRVAAVGGHGSVPARRREVPGNAGTAALTTAGGRTRQGNRRCRVAKRCGPESARRARTANGVPEWQGHRPACQVWTILPPRRPSAQRAAQTANRSNTAQQTARIVGQPATEV